MKLSRNILKLVLMSLWVCLVLNLKAQTNPAEILQLNSSNIQEAIRNLALEGKVRILVGTSKMPFIPPQPAPGAFTKPPLPEGFDFSTLFSEGKVQGAAGDSYQVDSMGIPSIVFADGPAGLRIDPHRKSTDSTFYCTAFPIATLLASSWDTALVYKVGNAMGNEVLEYGVDILLAPGMNLKRNPLTGRNFEYYSEDPIVSGKMAASMIKGIQSNGVGTSLKHFAVNNQETYRNGINVIIDERTLRETYLKGFGIAVKEGKPWTIMTSYNQINNVYLSESENLLTEVLRNEWGFKGFVLTDWWAEHDPVAQMKAGNDMLLPGHPDQISAIINAVRNGQLSEDVIDRNLEHILSIMVKTPACKKYRFTNKPDLIAHTAIARKAASEGMVLLKNDGGALPLKSKSKVALFGTGSYDLIIGGSGSGYVNRAYKVELTKGLILQHIAICDTLATVYTGYINEVKSKLPAENFWFIPGIEEYKVPKELIEAAAMESDIAVVTLRRISGEGTDRQLMNDFYLTNNEQELIKNVSGVFHQHNKKVIILINSGGVIESASWKKFVDAILLVHLPGQEAGNAIADVLTGKINPSGKLTSTYPVNYGDVASSKNFPLSDGNPSIVKYKEGIYVGYKYNTTFKVVPSFEFGFGLSYTTFTYEKAKVNNNILTDSLILSFVVKNVGKLAGNEIAQLYIHAPGKTMEKPDIELIDFAKTKLLKPGEFQQIKMIVKADDLASFDAKRLVWVTEPGEYVLKIAASSANIIKEIKVQVPKEIITKKVNRILPVPDKKNDL